ncbi:hypothetical protein CH275_10145 [Rhodococcus sp. 06-235-1A]|uniref:hypothetical protein n=1 Tax=Rhodococcus sp. 06-235-1A TaxID=2022508 RepID=UPI000B9A1DE9|nr:hypothetical protein [Rhodococcus sp. 06-235-1A]OZD06564.1 hypothetical protein CH275_10145 [Rhodococcus sp. 06-235-1A]
MNILKQITLNGGEVISDRWEWRGVRAFVARNREPGALDAWARAQDYLAVADAFGLSWPTSFDTVCRRLRRLGDENPHTVAEYIMLAQQVLAAACNEYRISAHRDGGAPRHDQVSRVSAVTPDALPQHYELRD